MKVSVLGSGIVGEVLSNGFLKHGYTVMRASREPEKLSAWKAKAGAQASIGTFVEAAKFADLVVLAVKGSAATQAIEKCGIQYLNGKTIIDTCNPIADEPHVQGVIKFITGPNESLMEKLQRLAPKANFVKAFSCVGNALMVNPNFGETKPTMFICGNNPQAKAQVQEILQQFGWEFVDMGMMESARAIEPLCMLWCIPGFRQNSWNHAFKLLRI